MKVLIFGGNGYLGGLFKKAYPEAVTLDLPEVDIADPRGVRAALKKHQPDVVINCAGATGRPNIDWCEDHKIETIHANVTGPLVLLEECTQAQARYVHLSSGCIYSGDNGGAGFSEDDTPNFTGSFYSRTKAYVENIVREFPVLILRLRMPFDASMGQRSLLGKLIKYERVLDVQNSVTYLPDFVKAAKQLIEKNAVGIYNMISPGSISPYQLMKKYQELVDPSHKFVRLTQAELPQVTKAGRSNCILNGAKLEKEGIIMRPVDEVVQEVMETLKKEKISV